MPAARRANWYPKLIAMGPKETAVLDCKITGEDATWIYDAASATWRLASGEKPEPE